MQADMQPRDKAATEKTHRVRNDATGQLIGMATVTCFLDGAGDDILEDSLQSKGSFGAHRDTSSQTPTDAKLIRRVVITNVMV